MKIINIKIVLTGLFLIVVTACNEKPAVKDQKDLSPSIVNSSKNSDNNNQVVLTPEQYKLAEIGIGKAELRNLSEVIKLNGEVEAEPSGIATLSAPLGGYIKSPGRLPGERVKKGQVLAVLENPKFISLQQDYLESLGSLDFLQVEYLRQQKLREQDVNSSKTFQQVSSEYKVLQAKLKGLEQNLILAGINIDNLKKGNISRTSNLYSPINGYIKSSNFNIGNYVDPKDVLFEIVNNEELHLVLNAYEKDVKLIEKGQQIRFALANEAGFNRKGKVFLVGQATLEDRIVPIHGHMDAISKKGVLPGMYIKAIIETGTQNQLAVPSEAIVKYEGNDFLLMQVKKQPDSYVFELIEVKAGISEDGYTAVTIPGISNPKEKDWVVRNAYAIISAKINAEAE